MGMMKNYLLNLVCACAPENGFAQDAIEHSILTGQVQLSGTYELEKDTALIMSQYDRIILRYRRVPLRLRTRQTGRPVLLAA